MGGCGKNALVPGVALDACSTWRRCKVAQCLPRFAPVGNCLVFLARLLSRTILCLAANHLTSLAARLSLLNTSSSPLFFLLISAGLHSLYQLTLYLVLSMSLPYHDPGTRRLYKSNLYIHVSRSAAPILSRIQNANNFKYASPVYNQIDEAALACRPHCLWTIFRRRCLIYIYKAGYDSLRYRPAPLSQPTRIPSRTMSDEYTVTLTLQPDNPSNTKLIDEDGNTAYTITTTFDDKSVATTTICDETGKRVADWIWRDMNRSHLLAFKDRKREAASNWLQTSMIPFKT